MALGCTLIVVAHRMAATRRARRVLVMDGAGIDVGSHEELLARHERYTPTFMDCGGRLEARCHR